MRMENIFGKFDITSFDMQYNRILKINMGRAMEYQHLYVLASHLFNIGVR